jgi:hypothetical protein
MRKDEMKQSLKVDEGLRVEIVEGDNSSLGCQPQQSQHPQQFQPLINLKGSCKSSV